MGKFLRVALIPLLAAMSLAGCGGDSTPPANSTPPADVTPTPPVSSKEPLICDQFELVTAISGETMQLSLETDLPDDTIISITVNRSYWEQGNSEEYSRPYFEEKSTVGEWRRVHEIDISSERWKQNLKNFQAEMSKSSLGFEVARISDDIEARIVAPINGQTNPGFGERNKYLEGGAVTERYGAKLVEGESQTRRPL